MSAVFADAFYYIALLNCSDEFHAAAVQATKALRRPLVTTAWVLTEVADALSAPAVRQRTGQFLQSILTDPNTTVLADFDPWFARGLLLYGNRLDKSWSLTDRISFQVMDAHGIHEALTGDHHFVQASYRALLLPGAESLELTRRGRLGAGRGHTSLRTQHEPPLPPPHPLGLRRRHAGRAAAASLSPLPGRSHRLLIRRHLS